MKALSLELRLIDLVSANPAGVHRKARLARERFVKFLSSPKIFAATMHVLEKTANPSSPSIGLIIESAVVHGKADSLFENNKAKFINYYNTYIQAKTRPEPRVCQDFNYLCSALSFDDLKASVLPLFESQAKKNPEVAIYVLKYFLQAVTADLSGALATSILPMLKDHIQSKTEGMRQLSAECIQAAAQKSGQAESIQAAVNFVLALPAGAPALRAAWANAVGALGASSAKDLDAVSSVVLAKLLPLVTGESNAEAQEAQTKALGQWLAKASQFSADAVKLFSTALVDPKKQDKVKSLLEALNTAAWNSNVPVADKFKQIPETFSKVLFQVFDKVKQRATLRAEGILLASFFAKISAEAASIPLATQIAKAGVWDYLFSGQSFLLTNPKEFVSRLDAAIFPVLVNFIELVCNTEAFDKYWKNSDGFFLLLTEGLVQGSWSSRHLLAQAINKTHKRVPDLSEKLLPTFAAFLAQATSPEDIQQFRAVLSGALLTFVSSTLPVSKFAELLVVAHHPYVGRPLSSSVFRNCVKRWGINVDDVVSENAEEIKAYLYGENGLLNPLENFSKAGVEAIRGLVSIVKSDSLAVSLLKPIETLIDSKQWLSLSDDQLGIFRTPEGTVFRQNKSSGYRVVAKKLTQEEQELEELRLSKLKKQGLEDPKEKAEREKKLQEEAVVRNQVKPIFQKLSTAISALVRVASSRHTALDSILFASLPEILKLLPSEDFTSLVEESLTSLSLDCFKHEFARPVARVLILGFGKNKLPTKAHTENLASGLEEIESSFKKRLSTCQFALVFPIIVELLTTSHPPAAQHLAMTVLENHVETVHQPQIVELLSRVISSIKRFQQRASAALLKATSKMDASDNGQKNLEVSADALMTVPAASTRLATINSLLVVKNIEESSSKKLVVSLWFSKHDSEPEIASKASQLYDTLQSKIGPDYLNDLLPCLSNESVNLRSIGGKAIAAAAALFPETYSTTLKALFEFYKSHIPTSEQIKYESDIVASWIHSRFGVAHALKECSIISHTTEQLKAIFDFLFASSFYDKDQGVYRKFDEAGSAIVAAESSENIHSFLLPYFRKIVTTPPGNDKNWNVYESALGYVAVSFKAIPRGSPDVAILIKELIDSSLTITSQDCRLVITQALIKLVSVNKEEGKKHLQRCFDLAVGAENQNDRRGGAFCFGGLARGVGVSTVLITMGYLQEVTKNLKSTSVAAVQGSIFVVEALSIAGQRLWEPYIVHVLAPLMNCFGHKDKKVQEATRRTGKVIMQNVSGGGLRIVLPGILASLTERSVWQAKIGSIEMLSILAHSQPKQLPVSLPIIIPALAGVLTDTHTKVQDTARKALNDIGKVIKNPEIQDHVPLLLEAINDPAVHSGKALEALLSTHFVHHIDSASLSFIMPVLKRALGDRNTSNKSKATKILGNMCQLTTQNDLKPYLEGLMEEIQSVLLDPIPSTRATAAKAVGALLRGMGEEEFSGLVSWLLDTIQTSTGFIERSGAAQGLSEVIASLPEHRFKLDLFPYIVQQTTSERPSTREGFISVFQFLPDAWGLSFAPYLDRTLPLITRGLADEVDGVREASLKAGQALVIAYALHATDLLIPSLKRGIFDDSWRIRQSSVQLLGEFLSRVLGRTIGGAADDDESVAVEDVTSNIGEVIGADSANDILAVLYFVRNDPNLAVQQKAAATWKSVVSNTPKMLKVVLPILMKLVISALEQKTGDKRQVARDTLADIVVKLGYRVLPEIIPYLNEALASENPFLREGACLGLCDVMDASGKTFLLDFLDELIPAVRIGLSDEVGMVQEAAAQAFDVLYENVGAMVINEIIPQLLHNLEDSDEKVSHMALNGLKQMLTVRATVVLPFVVPSLITTMSLFNARALASLAEVSGTGLYPHLKSIVNALLPTIYDSIDSVNEDMLKASTRVIRAIDEESGVEILLSHLIDLAKNTKPLWRISSLTLLCKFVTEPVVEFSSSITELVSTCLDLLSDAHTEIQDQAVKTMNAALKSVTPSEALQYIPGINGALDVLTRIQYHAFKSGQLKEDALPGLCREDGLDAILPLYLEAFRVSGGVEARVTILEGLRYLITLCSGAALSAKNKHIKIVGPLIRIYGPKLEAPIKIQIINTIKSLLEKEGIALRGAVPQLQTTLVTAVADAEEEVRELASPSLALLILHGAKIDFILKELIRLLNNASGAGVVAILSSLRSMLQDIKPGTPPPKPEIIASLKDTLFSYLNDEDAIRAAAAQAFGPFSKVVADQAVLLELLTVDVNTAGWKLLNGVFQAMTSIAEVQKDAFSSKSETLTKYLFKALDDDKVAVKQSIMRFMGTLLLSEKEANNAWVLRMSVLIDDPSIDVRVTALHTLKNLAKHNHIQVASSAPSLVVLSLPRAKDRKVVRIKFAAERLLLHLLKIHDGSSFAKTVAKSLDQVVAKDLSDFCSKVLSKLEESDDEPDFTAGFV
eukprot:TRINITY_DN6540_c0_g3_i1.p1 TRINITY_DN6540_c0_g3~~TRINITY_DN6540_c0_g3_i1.p1  ORF type:complete len:2511 (-),score=671.28 TRINITY_DN6540_c0_g3_i1:99-7439(-)